ncbi:MAG: AbrB family transcriptional regulator [Elusimicrobia bacterium HGW-Elusimicrobia-2]|nr:MAG: AbrB family transcriptional regulator [Elusimicrobia bacterium HGW-Elusimicrobia-2]
MNQVEVTSVSSKGQVVIPNDIRKELGICVGSKFIVVTDGTNVLLKPVRAPKMEAFRKLIKESQRIAFRAGIKKSALVRIIKKARNESRN